MQEQSERNDRRVKRSRRLLQRSLMELMVERRFSSITVRDITERAEVNRGTFYTHFADKTALVEAILHDQLHQRLASHLPQTARWEKKYLRILVQTILEVFDEAYDRCPPAEMINPLLRQTVQEYLVEVLLRWLKRVRAPKTAWRSPVEIIAVMISWAILGAAMEWSQGEKTLSIQQMTDHVLTVITEGAARLTPGGLPE
jgi:AcrR family transcriptional regulator